MFLYPTNISWGRSLGSEFLLHKEFRCGRSEVNSCYTKDVLEFRSFGSYSRRNAAFSCALICKSTYTKGVSERGGSDSKTPPKRLQNAFKTHSQRLENALKTPPKRLQNAFLHAFDTPSERLQNPFKTHSKRLQNAFVAAVSQQVPPSSRSHLAAGSTFISQPSRSRSRLRLAAVAQQVPPSSRSHLAAGLVFVSQPSRSRSLT